MPVLTKDAILTADDLEKITEPVPEWGGDVILTELPGNERDALETFWTKCRDKQDFTGLRAYVCSVCIVDEAGTRIFTAEDVEAIHKKNSKVLERLFSKAAKLNGLSGDDVEDEIKNSSGEEANSSGSSSPGPSPTPASGKPSE